MPTSLPNSACPPRKAKTPQGPKSRNIVDVDKLKASNENQEPGIEKKNVKFLFGLLEQASNEREQLLNQLADKDETIEMISQQRHLEEVAFRKVLTTERKKFDKKILDARNMLQRREDMLSAWSQIGVIAARKCAEKDESEDLAKVVALLKRTCKFLPDSLDADQKEEFNIVNTVNEKEEKEENENEEEEVTDNQQEDDFDDGFDEYDEDNNHAPEYERERHDLDENSIGGHTMSGSILKGEAREKGKQSKNNNKSPSKVDSRLNMGSGILEGTQPPNMTSMSMSDMAVDQDINNSTSMQFPSLSHMSVNDNDESTSVKNQGSTSVASKKVSGPVGISSSYHEQSHNSRGKEDEPRRKKKNSSSSTPGSNKKFESASMDISDTSSKKYWWDHLVDDNSVEKGKEDLMLGSGLDKGDRESQIDDQQQSKINDDDNDEVNEVDMEDGVNKGNVDSSADGGAGSVMSLCSDDFKFSTTST